MSQPPPTDAAPAAPADSEYVEVLIPGRAHPLRIQVPRGCTQTTVRELREAVLAELRRQDPNRAAPYIRLIFRGKELKGPEETLVSQSVRSGSALHGMITSVQPHSQQRESEAETARRAARDALASAVGSLFGGDAGEGGNAVDPAQVPAGARAQMSQNELMRLLHEETMLRRAAQQQGGQGTTTTAEGAAQDAAVPVRSNPAPDAQTREEVVQTTDGGRVRVTTLAGDARGPPRQNAPQEDRVEEDEQEVRARRLIESFKELKWSFVAALMAGFFLGPVGFFLPFQTLEMGCVAFGFFVNILFNFIW